MRLLDQLFRSISNYATDYSFDWGFAFIRDAVEY